jgi:hypothetical protein
MQSFKEKPFPNSLYGVAAIPTVYAQNSNVFLVVARKKNGNVMVYEAVLDANRNISNINSFWLDLEPSYKQNARKRGRLHDVDELSKIDYFGYGVEIIRKITSQKWEIQFNQYKQKMVIKVHETGVSLYRKGLKDEVQKVHHLFLHDRQVLNMLPTVDSIDVVSFRLSDKRKIVEKVIVK